MIYSKTPFRLNYIEDNGNTLGDIESYTIVTKNNQVVVELPVNETTKEDAEYIVKACNQYPILLDLLTRFRFTLKEDSMYHKLIEHHINNQ